MPALPLPACFFSCRRGRLGRAGAGTGAPLLRRYGMGPGGGGGGQRRAGTACPAQARPSAEAESKRGRVVVAGEDVAGRRALAWPQLVCACLALGGEDADDGDDPRRRRPTTTSRPGWPGRHLPSHVLARPRGLEASRARGLAASLGLTRPHTSSHVLARRRRHMHAFAVVTPPPRRLLCRPGRAVCSARADNSR